MSDELPFTFGVPLLPRAAAGNWELVEALLDLTLASILAQSDHRFSVVIAGHDRPAIRWDDSRISFLRVPYPAASQCAGNADRGRKVYAIAEHVLHEGGGLLAFIDADDWVDRRFVEVSRASLGGGEIGGFLQGGLAVDLASLKAITVPDARVFPGGFVEICGSSIVARLRPGAVDPVERNPHGMLHEHHRWPEARALDPGRIVELPLVNAYVVNSTENHSEQAGPFTDWRRELNEGVNRFGRVLAADDAARLGLSLERIGAVSSLRRRAHAR